MLPRLLILPLLAAGLLLGTSGCITEPVYTIGTGSYKLDGIEKRCDVVGDVTNPVVQNQPYDQLDIQLQTTPEPASGPEYVFLTFTKLQYQPAATYQLKSMRYRATGGLETTYPLNTVTLQENRGTYSGTFSGTAAGTTTAPLAITDGMFIDVHP